MWNDVPRTDFGDWLQNTDYEARVFCVTNFTVFSARKRDKPLRFLFIDTPSNVEASDITFLKPLFDTQTISNNDVQKIVDTFFSEYMAGTPRQFALLSGDFQVWMKLFMLHKRYPEKYGWLIPVPGEWHWTWHIIKAIYATYYWHILLPFSQKIGFSKLDREAKDFHYAEDLLG